MSIDFSRETVSGLTAIGEQRGPSDTEHGRLGDVLDHELKRRRRPEKGNKRLHFPQKKLVPFCLACMSLTVFVLRPF